MGNRGPRPLPPEEKRIHRVGLYLNEAELEDLEGKIGLPGLAELVRMRSKRRCGMRDISDLLRSKLLAQRAPVRQVVPELNQRLVADLGRVGGNINQIAHHLNQAALTGFAKTDPDSIFVELHQLRDVLEDALLGISSPAKPHTLSTTPPSSMGRVDFVFDF